jgi:hypothetical protein
MDQTVPGVLHQRVVLTPPARLRTGVPGFVGFANPGRRARPQLSLQRN